MSGEGAPLTFSERLIERGDGDFVDGPGEPPPLERQQTAVEPVEQPVAEAAPKKRWRPKAQPKEKPEAKKRGRPPKPVEEPEPAPPPPPFDLHAIMVPLVQHYIAASPLRRESAKRQRDDGMFQNMMARRF